MPQKLKVAVEFMDGKSLLLEFAELDASRTALAEALERLRTAQSIVFEADKKLMVIPTANIRLMEFTPAPKAGLPGIVTGGKIIRRT